MSNITEDRLANLLRNCEFMERDYGPGSYGELAAALRELQLLRASPPVLSEEMREALEAGAMALEFRSRHWQGTGADEAYDKPAALLRAMAQRGG